MSATLIPAKLVKDKSMDFFCLRGYGWPMKIAIGCDHAGYLLKVELLVHLKKRGIEVFDHGCPSLDRADYPDYAILVGQAIQEQKADLGVLVCGTGIGMAMTANKLKGIRAASLTDIFSTEMTRRHNDLNVLCLGARVVGGGLAERLVDAFLDTNFEGGRHAERLKKITEIESK